MDQQAATIGPAIPADGGGPARPGGADFLAGGGEMGALMRAHDWAATPLGPVEGWPQGLRSAAGIMLNSRYPIALYWGPELALVYNDDWSPIPGGKHPWALGRPAREVWPEIWDTIGPLFDHVFATGEGTWSEDQLLPMHRHGYTEECYFNFTFSPIRGEGGRVEGVFNAVVETTERVLSERRLRTLSDLGARVQEARDAGEACERAARIFERSAADVPFALVYLLDAAGDEARLAASAGMAPGHAAAPARVDLAGDPAAAAWPLREVALTGEASVVPDAAARLGPLPGGPWPEPAADAVVLPLVVPGQTRPAGFLVCGVNPRRRLDAHYRSFLDLAAGHVATAVANARAYEAERRRAEALAELDRAKTTFFSNISHELRTPLTLMLGPIEELLARPGLPATEREPLEVAHRNSLRLLKLVNTLLDFSRIEAGRARARYEPVDLAALTADLASGFRAAFERAGLALEVDCPPLPAPVHVDRDMWEKVVLNLLSNAFKHTFEGGVTVRVRPAEGGAAAELAVRDTGVGVPAHELPRLFERFHRVEGQRSRSHEGSGIGLALVHELVRLHGGSIEVRSEVGRGSEFVVTVPLGTAHLPAGQVAEGAAVAGAGPAASPVGVYAEEAARWLPDDAAAPPPLPAPEGEGRPRLLLADDNADMREYVRRLLAGPYEVEAVADGEAALASLRARRPDLLLSDVMMPGLDGFALLREVRADPALRDLPVIMLSARAGEEARVEGLDAGADDYLTKPFGARELTARVAANLATARIRSEAAQALREREAELARVQRIAGVGGLEVDLRDAAREGFRNRRSPEYLRLHGLPPEAANESHEDWVRRLHPEDRERVEAHFKACVAGGAREYAAEYRIVRPSDGAVRWISARAEIERDAEGRPLRLVGAHTDVTALKEAEAALRESEALLRLSQEAGRVGSFARDLRTGVVTLSEGGRLIFGLPPGELSLTREGWLAALHPEDRERAAAAMQAAYASGAEGCTVEYRIVRPSDGAVRHVENRARFERDAEGRAVRAVGVHLDVTERKAAEAALRASEERYRFATLAVTGVVYDYDLATGRVHRSAGLRDLIGLDPADCPEDAAWWQARIHPEDLARLGSSARELYAGAAEQAAIEYRVRHEDGSWVDVVDRSYLVRDAAGRPARLIGVTSDVTARKRAEAALVARDAEFREAQRLAHIGSWRWDAATDATTGSDELYRIYGLDPAAGPFPDFRAQRGVLYPAEDWERIDAAVRRAVETGAGYELDVRAFRGGAEPIWVTTRCEVLRGGDGRVVGLRGTVQDITERKVAEERLAAERARFEAIVETVPAGILVAEAPSGRITYGNRRVEEVLRHPIFETPGVEQYGRWAGFHPDGRPVEGREWPLARALAGETVRGEEYVYQRGDGTRAWVRASGAPIRGRDGAVAGALVSLYDVDLEKRAEEQRELLLHELSHRVKNILAVVQAIAAQTAARSATVADLLDAFRGRLRALSVAHELLTAEGWRGADLASLAGSTLGPYVGDGRVRLGLPRASLDPAVAQTLSLALHELATNAAKHGALSAPGGRVTLDGAAEGLDGGRRLAVVWREEGGPPVEERPAVRGFGTTLLTRAIAHQHRGRVELDWRREGLVCRIELPLPPGRAPA